MGSDGSRARVRRREPTERTPPGASRHPRRAGPALSRPQKGARLPPPFPSLAPHPQRRGARARRRGPAKKPPGAAPTPLTPRPPLRLREPRRLRRLPRHVPPRHVPPRRAGRSPRFPAAARAAPSSSAADATATPAFGGGARPRLRAESGGPQPPGAGKGAGEALTGPYRTPGGVPGGPTRRPAAQSAGGPCLGGRRCISAEKISQLSRLPHSNQLHLFCYHAQTLNKVSGNGGSF